VINSIWETKKLLVLVFQSGKKFLNRLFLCTVWPFSSS